MIPADSRHRTEPLDHSRGTGAPATLLLAGIDPDVSWTIA